MLEQDKFTDIPVFVNYFPNKEPVYDMIEATFYWAGNKPFSPFDLPQGTDLSFRMNAAFLGQLLAIRLYRRGMYENMDLLEQTVGPELTDCMINAKSLGFIALKADLTEANRTVLARFTAESAAAPAHLRILAGQVIQNTPDSGWSAA